MIEFELNEVVCNGPFSLKFRMPSDVRKIFKETVDVWQSVDGYKLLCIKNVYEIICFIRKEMDKTYMTNSRDRLIDSAINEIHKQFASGELSVPQLARLCGIGETYFRRLFRNKTGVSPREYIARQRISYAEQILKTRQISIAEVAALCGYAEVSSFSREFTKRMGMSPLEYKKKFSA